MIDDWRYPVKTEGIRRKIYVETAAYPQIGRCPQGPARLPLLPRDRMLAEIPRGSRGSRGIHATPGNPQGPSLARGRFENLILKIIVGKNKFLIFR